MAVRLAREAPKRNLWSPDQKRWYVRRAGKYHRITADPGSAEFDRQYWEIMAGRAAPAPVRTTWRALWEAYSAGPWFAELKPRTRADYRALAEYLLSANGDKDVTAAKRLDVIRAMEANRHRVRFANYLRALMSVLFGYAQHLGWRDDNPAQGVRSLKMPKARQKPHEPWPDSAVELFRQKAGARARLIFELALGSVQRPGDLVRFTWGDFDGKALRLVQGKTGKELHLPCGRFLLHELVTARGLILAESGDLPPPSRPIIAGPDGGRVTYFALAAFMLKERKALGLEAFDLHALRYRGIMELAFSGCDDAEIEAYSGHASKAMVRKYAGRARQIMRAQTAAAKREQKQDEK